MKVRTGFVSNSSSSSFIIGIPKGKELTVKYLKEALDIPENAFVNEIVEPILSVLTYAEKVSSDNEEEFFEYQGSNYINLRDQMDFYEGWASDDSGSDATTFVCNHSFNIEGEKLIIQGGGGY